jgi:squalene cyclase
MDAKARVCEKAAHLWMATIGVLAGSAAFCLAPGSTVRAEDKAVEQAVERGLAFLASRQHDDGYYGSDVYRGHVAVTAFVGRAMMATGSKPGEGTYGNRVSKSLEYLMSRVQNNGMITSKDAREPAPMYGHGFALMFLAECQKAAPQAELKEKMAKAVQLSVKSQNKDGGWRYLPVPREADLSVTVTQLSALAAARDAGVDVPQETIDRAVNYVKRSQNEDGGFRYLLEGGTSGFARSAAAVAALYRAGAGEGPEVRKGCEYVAKFPPADTIGQPEVYYFYGHYYAAQVMSRAGEEAWNRWYAPVRDKLLKQQNKDGAWPDAASVELGTAMACLTLKTGPVETKPAESKPEGTKPAESNPDETKPADKGK